MKKWAFLALLLPAALMLCAAPAQAATADFLGNCTSGTSIGCQFDAQQGSGTSCPGSFIWKYSWVYGDGSSSGLTGNSLVSHTYTSPFAAAYQVDLTIFCWDGNQASKTRFVCVSAGFPGCIFLDSGWN